MKILDEFLPFQLNPDTYDILVFAVVYDLDWLATGPPTVQLTSNIFGRHHVIVFGWISVSHQLGAAIATFSAGFLHTIFGNYQWSFMSGAILCFMAVALVAQIPKLENLRSPYLKTGDYWKLSTNAKI